MNYDGEKFLLKLYKELYNEKSVKHSSTKSNDKYEAIKKYIERLERVHERAINHKNDNGVKLLKSFYYDKYVIKKEDIPESYINYLDKVQFDQYGIHMNESQTEEQKDLIIENQKKSLDEWLNYFTNEDAKFYPTWAKYWAFQGMLTIGNYDTNKGIYNKRSKTTVAPFPELDREVLSKSIDLVIKEVNKEEINDKDLEQLVKNGNFFKLYTVQLKDKRNQTFGNDTKGEWIKYEQGNNYQELYKSLQGKNTGWCTAGEKTCKLQVEGGDFYVYYTYDEEGKATIPRLAIRMDGKNTIGEIRGVAKDQNIEPHFEDVLAKKLENFKDADRYKKRIKDTKMLTYVYTKYKNNKLLTEEDLKFIYEINGKIKTMGWTIDSRLNEMKNEVLDNIKQNFQDTELILGLVKKDLKVMHHISEDKLDKDLALNIVKNNGCAIKYIPKDLIDRDLIIEAIKNNVSALSCLKRNEIDKELVLMAVEKASYALKYVPKDLIEKNIIQIAVEQNPISIKYVPKEMLDKKLIINAVKQDSEALECIPKEMLDKEIILIAVQNNGKVLQFVPEDLIDKDVALMAVKNDEWSIRFVPKDKIDNDIILAAVKKDHAVIGLVSKDKLNKNLLLELVSDTKSLILERIPKELIDKDIALVAVKNDGWSIRYIPKEIIDKEIAMEAIKAVKASGGNYMAMILRFIPEEIIDKEIALIAVKEFEFALELIPEEIIDKEIIFIAKCNETKYKLNLSEQQKKLLEEALQEEIEKAQTLGKQGTLLTKETLKEKYKNEAIYNLIKSSNQEGYNYYLKSQKNKVRKK